MPIEDKFPHEGRFDAVGLDCSNCKHQMGSGFPNINRDYCCALHQISLTIELQENGYKLWEWFCKDFENNGSAEPAAVAHFNQIKESLASQTLYRLYNDDGYLKEFAFSELGECPRC
jgi:hypothetical protein